VADTVVIAAAARSGDVAAVTAAPSASAIITARLCATMSCRSRAIRARSPAATSRSSCSRSRSTPTARSASCPRYAWRVRTVRPSSTVAAVKLVANPNAVRVQPSRATVSPTGTAIATTIGTSCGSGPYRAAL
jgi:hypothetical protein